MPLIETIISSQNFELIRDRIADILIDEIQGQADLGNDIGLKQLFTERHIPLDKTHLPAVCVSLGLSNYDNKSTRSIDGHHDFYIDVYVKEKSDDSSDGDKIASKKVQKIVGMIRMILESPIYFNLGWTPRIIERSIVSNIEFGTVQIKDELNIQMARITYKVQAAESVKLTTADIIYDYQTQVKIADLDAGYFFSGIGSSTPDPGDTCDPAILNVNGSLFTTIASGGTLNLRILDQNGDPTGSKTNSTTWTVNTGSGGTLTEEQLYQYTNIQE